MTEILQVPQLPVLQPPFVNKCPVVHLFQLWCIMGPSYRRDILCLREGGESAGMNYISSIQWIIYCCVRKYYFYLLNVLIYLLFVTFNVITSNIKNNSIRGVGPSWNSILLFSSATYLIHVVFVRIHYSIVHYSFILMW